MKQDNTLGEFCKKFAVSQPYVRLSSLTEQPVRRESLTYDGRPMWLAEPRASQIVVDSILWGVADRYELFAWVVMSNQVHILIQPLLTLHKITQGTKGFTAYLINRLQQAPGRVLWQNESYDHWVRDEEEMFRIIEYIENNPVAAGLCVNQDDWPFSSARIRKERNWARGEPWRS